MKKIAASFAAIALCMMMISACAPHKMYRDIYNDVCKPPNSDCERHALQKLPGDNGTNYLLGFIEFDDQGQLWDREQMGGVLTALEKEADSNELLIVVFAHGWKHSAAPDDANIKTFRDVLAQLSADEVEIQKSTRMKARQVAGVYLGWRGGSMTVPYLENITFWDRKNTAQKVGHGGASEVLIRLEDIRTKKEIACRSKIKKKEITEDSKCGTRLAVVGHSFGGAFVYTALAQILEDRFFQPPSPNGQESNVEGFGDLVVLINPAFEANLFTPLSDMSTEKSPYLKSQLPVMAILTSEADTATSDWFPRGRWLSTRFEKENHDHQRKYAVKNEVQTISAYEANITAVGHFEPYRTHRLKPSQPEQNPEELKAATAERSAETFRQISDDWINDAPGKSITIGDVVLTRTENSAGRNPYLVIRVNKNLIKDHNNIDDPRVIEFIKQLILITSYKQEQTEKVRKALDTPPRDKGDNYNKYRLK